MQMQYFLGKMKGDAAPRINIKVGANHSYLHLHGTPVIEVVKQRLPGAGTNDAALLGELLHRLEEELPSLASTSVTLLGGLCSCWRARNLALQRAGPLLRRPCLGSLHMGGAPEEAMWVTGGEANVDCWIWRKCRTCHR